MLLQSLRSVLSAISIACMESKGLDVTYFWDPLRTMYTTQMETGLVHNNSTPSPQPEKDSPIKPKPCLKQKTDTAMCLYFLTSSVSCFFPLFLNKFLLRMSLYHRNITVLEPEYSVWVSQKKYAEETYTSFFTGQWDHLRFVFLKKKHLKEAGKHVSHWEFSEFQRLPDHGQSRTDPSITSKATFCDS